MEILGRYQGDTSEVLGRYQGDTGEYQGDIRGNTTETLGRYREIIRRYQGNTPTAQRVSNYKMCIVTNFRPTLDQVYTLCRPSLYSVCTWVTSNLSHVLHQASTLARPTLDQFQITHSPGLDQVHSFVGFQFKFEQRFNTVQTKFELSFDQVWIMFNSRLHMPQTRLHIHPTNPCFLWTKFRPKALPYVGHIFTVFVPWLAENETTIRVNFPQTLQWFFTLSLNKCSTQIRQSLN